MKKNDPFEGIFDNLQDNSILTDEQKQKMRTFVLAEGVPQDESFMQKLGAWITVRPWRFAFCASAVQAAVFTLIFGAQYTNLLLSVFGG